MGVIKWFSSGSNDSDWDKNYSVNLSTKSPFIKVEQVTELVRVTPDPSKYDMLNMRKVGDYLILKIHYHDATNYEGVKILVFKGLNYAELLVKNYRVIDPHFMEYKDKASPIARFEPTDEGWRMALEFCEMLNNYE